MKTIHSGFFLLALFINACASQPEQFVSKNYEEQSDNLEGTVLVAYATRAGSTIEVTDSIAYAIAGIMDYSKLNRFDRFIVKRMIKAPEEDFRDWNKISEWAEEML